MLRAIAFLFLAAFLAGCGNRPEGKQLSSEELDKLARDRMSGIANDKSLSDADAFKKYFDTHGSKPMVVLPKDVEPWWAVKPSGDGHWLTIRDLDHTLSLGSSVDDANARIRNRIKSQAKMAAETLTDFQPRKLKGVTVQLFTSITGQKDHTEMLRIVYTPTDVAKLDPLLKGPADTGTAFDPRDAKINTLGKVELNRYPELVFEKKK